ncbi:MAG: ABC transporter permease [Desulfobacteraceae bacterium]|nr:ABC transporter permease [Desulfobacteraceae bacterium]
MKQQKQAYFKFLIYLVVIVLVNVAGVTLFFRLDLTQNGIYSLSDASRTVVSTLSEPLTIKVFFTKNLPAPHNNTERYLHDLMDEYARAGGRFFNYMFYDVTAREAGLTDEADRNRKQAEDYGITPVQIRVIENDEVKFQQAYMGLVIIHGDMVEKIPALTATDGLEYKLTTAIQKLNNKVSTLLSLEEKVKIRMYLSSSLSAVAPFMGLDGLDSLPERITQMVGRLNARSLDTIDFKYVDPSKENNLDTIAEKYKIMVLKWPDLARENIRAGKGGAGLVVEYGEKRVELPLISSFNVPILGPTYQMTEPEMLEDLLADTMESMIGINQPIGYLGDHGTPVLSMPGMGMMGQQQRSTMNVFNQLISQRYSIKQVNLKDEGIPEDLTSLIISRPQEKFTDYELFQIDQALMRGTSLAILPEPFKETMPGQSAGFMGGGPVYTPIDTGLSKLLAHYGVSVGDSYVMDEECYKQMMDPRRGGGEQKIYFAPMIDASNIDNTPGYMENIKGLVAMKISPLTVEQEKLDKAGIKAVKLFSSSKKAWEMKKNINLNPMFLQPPADDEKDSFALAYMLEGSFPSYFAGKPVPHKEVAEAETKEGEDGNAPDLSRFQASNTMIATGKPGKVFVMACPSMLQDNMLDSEGRTTNATFVLNVIDHLNGQNEIAAMRSKKQSLNPLAETTPLMRRAIKVVNIGGLPVLVIMFGFGIWVRRRARKRRIKGLFVTDKKE